MNDYAFCLSQGGWDTPDIRRAWDALIARCDDAGVLAKCPEMLDHLLRIHDPSLFHLATLRDGDGTLVGVVPLRVMRAGLNVEVSGRILWESRARAVAVLGGLPLLPADTAAHDLFFAEIARQLPGYSAVALPVVPVDSFLWRYLRTSAFIGEEFLVHSVDGVRRCHTIPLPDQVREYRARMSGKKRYNLRRQIRLLDDFCGGRLRLLRVESPHQVDEFVEAIRPAGRFAGLSQWGHAAPFAVDRDEAAGLAGRGLLLNYVLMCAGRPCAVLTGLRYRGVFYLSSIPRDRALDRFSPGSTALHLAIEDLIRETTIRRVDLGFGEPTYAHSSTNVVETRASVLLLRRTTKNRLRRGVHAVSRSVVDLIKSRVVSPSR